ncbi:ComF family protein [Rickettsia endosymbiont of Cardiosporidium cionae]|uniref:ComF family protein n=1 Tax=Rickettsia endosymbiont of Cardiosporidium cionae TaxID=2777155 RepID=UPI001893FF27|nr:ComF family protein [Rickettsia endosymbiont of Cardiosporidium cionae]
MNKPYYDISRALFSLDSYSQRLVYDFKYHDKTDYAKIFAKLLVNRYYQYLQGIDFISAVPMHRLKRWYRYYNPPQLLAIEISKLLNIPVLFDVLIKIKLTKPQSFLSRKAREKNLHGSISFNSKYNLAGHSLLLVDDVYTTGSTVNTCSKILKNQGKLTKIVVFTLSHVLLNKLYR